MLRCFALISWEIVNEIFFLLNGDNNLFVCHVWGNGRLIFYVRMSDVYSISIECENFCSFIKRFKAHRVGRTATVQALHSFLNAYIRKVSFCNSRLQSAGQVCC